MTGLKPCPFCGGKNIFVGSIEQIEGASQGVNTHYDNTHFKAVCDFTKDGCGATTGGQYDNPQDAAEAWNRRTGRG